MTDKAEHEDCPAARRVREQFDAKYGDLSEVMRAIIRYRSAVDEFRRPGYPSENLMISAEESMLAEIRRYGTRSTEQQEVSEQQLRESLRYRWLLSHAISSDQNGNLVIHYETARDYRSHGSAESLRYWVNSDVAQDSNTFDEEEDSLSFAALTSVPDGEK